MTTLFIDTTKYVTVGLLDKDLEWMEYSFFNELKASAGIHFKIDNILINNNLNIQDIDQVVYMAGPGSYTGMRVSAGIAQVFDFSGFKTYSIFHYEVPQILGVATGQWYSDAFKNEDFLYTWNLHSNNRELINKSKNSDKEDYYTAFNFENSYLSTDLMIKENSKIIFSHILDAKPKRDLYYYRSLDKEFGANL